MMNYNKYILLGALAILLWRARQALQQGQFRAALRDDKATGETYTFAASAATEDFERRAIRNAKSGGGFVTRPVNRNGVITDVNCYVQGEIDKQGQVGMRCEL